MAVVKKQPDLVQELLSIRQRLAKLENAPRLTASSIQTNGNSRLTVLDALGEACFEAGDIKTGGGNTVPGMAVFRGSTGVPGLSAVSSPTLGSQFGFIDANNHVVMQTNETTGFGLEDPSIPVAVYSVTNIPSMSGVTPVQLWIGSFNTTHSYLDVQVQVNLPLGQTYVVTVQFGGVTVATSSGTGLGNFATVTISNILVTPTNTVKNVVGLGLLGTVTSGAGTLQMAVNYLRLHGSLG